MENLHFSFENIIAENGIVVSIMGMLIVFLSLAFISLFITYLPKMLAGVDSLMQKRAKAEEAAVEVKEAELEEDADLYAAICTVIALEVELHNFGDDQRITLKTDPDVPSAWATVGKVRTLSTRIAS